MSGVTAGYARRRHTIVEEFHLLALKDEVRVLRRALVRLALAVDDYLHHPTHESLERLRLCRGQAKVAP